MQTIYLTDTDELPKKRMQQTIKKTQHAQKAPNPRRISLRDMQLHSPGRIISI